MIIAEACQNWNGDLEILRDMVSEAARCGAKFIKVQSFFAEDLAPGWEGDFERLKRLELSWENHEKFVDWCKDAGIEPMTTVYAKNYLPKLRDLGFKWIKIASPQVGNTELLNQAKIMDFRIVVSTGGTPIGALSWDVGQCDFILHCVSKYPHHLTESSMLRMIELQNKFPEARVGWSDHSDPRSPSWLKASALALYLGGQMIERHFTILPANQTKDGCVSINSTQLRELVSLSQLNNKQILNMYPDFGLFYFPKRDTECKLISRYAKRWKVV